ncbi:HdeA/HdeB family chaperone [Pannus brasiliensis CCIBt3594]|uniref:HdeA/HdeB family chaperone n=1 Tax=Pannus brasiliensis CCIBt3594 TaxID=1427578 RepID=A0AAW9QZE6_9CHRO
MRIQFALPALILVTIASQSLAPIAKAETRSNPSMFNMEAVTCRELLLASSENRALMMSLFHGFFNGKKNETMFDVDRLAQLTDQIENVCADNPKRTLISVFQEYRGRSR